MSDGCRPRRKLNFCVAATLLGLLLQSVEATFTRCTTTAAVEGQSAAVTCHFHEDVWAYERHVNILRYDLDGQSYVPELALKCYWPDPFDFKCTTGNGFEFDGRVGKSLTLTIGETTEQHGGVYVCDTTTVERINQRNCTLHVKGRSISCKNTSVEENAPTSLSCHFNSDLLRTRDGFFVRYAASGSSDYVDVVRCNWLEDEPFCISKPGCNVTVTSSGREVTIDIPPASMVTDGRYFCDTVGLDQGVTVDTCQVLVKRKSTTLPTTTMATTRRTTVATTKPTLFHRTLSTVSNKKGDADLRGGSSAGMALSVYSWCSVLLVLICSVLT